MLYHEIDDPVFEVPISTFAPEQVASFVPAIVLHMVYSCLRDPTLEGGYQTLDEVCTMLKQEIMDAVRCGPVALIAAAAALTAAALPLPFFLQRTGTGPFTVFAEGPWFANNVAYTAEEAQHMAQPTEARFGMPAAQPPAAQPPAAAQLRSCSHTNQSLAMLFSCAGRAGRVAHHLPHDCSLPRRRRSPVG